MRSALRTQLGWLRDLWLIVGVTLLLFLSTELLTSVLFHLKDSSAAKAVVDHRAEADTYSHAGWPSLYYKELADSSTAQWASYVYWKKAPFRGQYINVDRQGNRVTWSADVAAPMSNDDVNILMLGGSTVWGIGSRDEFTIPSLLAKKLAERGVRARVTNLGQIGYVSTQDVTALLLEVQKGNDPDIVIFYNGFNDIFSAYQQGKAGLPQNEFHRVQDFNSRMPKATTLHWEIVAKDLSTVRAAKALLHRVGAMKSAQASAPNQGEMVDGPAVGQAEALARDVVEVYRVNVENAKALAAHFGFKVLFYWQPTLFEKLHLTAYEQTEKRAQRKFQSFFEETYRTMRTRNLAPSKVGLFHDLSRIFFETPAPLFVDWCHIGETGNALIADRMMTDVWPMVQRRAAATVGR